MDNRFQYLLLNIKAIFIPLIVLLSPLQAAADDGAQKNASALNNEVFELSIFAGIINVEDFGSELAPGVSATFRATEDFFIQYNYLQAKMSLSSYEKRNVKSGIVNQYFQGDERTFKHYDLLVGYNLFQGEFSPSTANTNLSNLHIVAGVGDIEFGGESNFSYTWGFGYQVSLTRRFALHFDYRHYIYKSNLVFDQERSVSATQISTGASFLF